MGYRTSMQRRWIIGLVLVGAASGGLYVATRGGDRASSATESETATPERNAPTPRLPGRKAPPPDKAPDARYAKSGRKILPLDKGKADVSPHIKKWKEEGLPGEFREIVKPDDSKQWEQELMYRSRRLRFELTDAAATCYRGGEGEEQMIVSYDLIIEDEVMKVGSLRMLSSSFSDKSLEACILERVAALEAPAEGMPDDVRPSKSVIDQRSMFAANKRAMTE
jgi:hypothetical protein